MKVVINKCFGGFGLTHEAIMRYAEIKGITLYPFVEDPKFPKFSNPSKFVLYDGCNKGKYDFVYYSTTPLNDAGTYENDAYFSERDIKRDDLALVQVVEEMGKKANDQFASLEVVEIPDGTDFEVEEYDGLEHIAEVHKTWG
jgi:hypothetical protein